MLRGLFYWQGSAKTASGLGYGEVITSHNNDVLMSAMTSQITGASVVCSTVGSGTDQRKSQSSASLAFVRGIHRWPMNSPHKRPVTRKMFPFDEVIMHIKQSVWLSCHGLSRLNWRSRYRAWMSNHIAYTTVDHSGVTNGGSASSIENDYVF